MQLINRGRRDFNIMEHSNIRKERFDFVRNERQALKERSGNIERKLFNRSYNLT